MFFHSVTRHNYFPTCNMNEQSRKRQRVSNSSSIASTSSAIHDNILSRRNSPTKNSSLESSSKRKQIDLFQCYATTNKNLIVLKRNKNGEEGNPIKQLKEQQFSLESFPMAKLVLALFHESKKLDKLTWIVMMVEDLSIFTKPSHWKRLNGIYFKLRLNGKTKLARLIREGNLDALKSAHVSFTSKHSSICEKHVTKNECIAIINKPVTCYKGVETEFLVDRISCFESSKWIDMVSKPVEANVRQEKDSGIFEGSQEETDEIQVLETSKQPSYGKVTPKSCVSLTGGLIIPKLHSTPIESKKAKENNRQPQKRLFYERCNKTPEDMLSAIDESEKDYMYFKDTCNSLVKTLNQNEVAKPLLENMLRLISMQQENMQMLTKILKKEQINQLEVPDEDKTKIDEDHVMIEGVLKLPMKNYRAAIAQRDPSKIVSHMVRKCFPQEWWNCYLACKDRSKQLSWVLGDDELPEKDRLEDGDKKIMALIVHAHRQVNKKRFTYREQQDGRREISQALSDLRRSLKNEENHMTNTNRKDVREKNSHGSPSSNEYRKLEPESDNQNDGDNDDDESYDNDDEMTNISENENGHVSDHFDDQTESNDVDQESIIESEDDAMHDYRSE